MIHQALTDALEARDDRNAQILQLPDRADAGAQEMRGRMDRATGKNNFMSPHSRFAAVDIRLDADAARALEQQLLDMRMGQDRQVGEGTRFAVEIAHRRRDASRGLAVWRDRKIAVDEFAVLIRQERVAGLLEGLGCGLRMPGP